MKNTILSPIRASSILCLMAVASFAGAQSPTAPAGTSAPAGAPAPEAPPADTSPEHTSYLFGLTFGEQMHNAGISTQVNQEQIARGVKDGLEGKKSTRLDQQQIQGFVRQVMSETAARNKQAAKDFLEKNGKDKAVKTTASGLQYKVLVPGNLKAAAVKPTDEVTVNYRGKLLDGTEFDSSYSRGQSATFKLNGVIKGWQEGLVLMKPGSKYQLFVPPELAYGDNPRPGIPGGSLLIFEVELLSAKEQPAAAEAPAGAPGALPGRRAPQPAPPNQPAQPNADGGAPAKQLDQ
jgi:FKBP-type peptidyl-prolyl cis-trans isomerase